MAERTVLLDATAEVRGAHLTLIRKTGPSRSYRRPTPGTSRAAACRAIPPDTRPVAPGPLTISGSQVNWRELPWE